MKPSVTHTAIVVLFVGTISYLMAVFSYLSPPVVALEIMKTLHLNPDSLSLMFAATMVAYGLVQPLSGFWADRFGPRWCLVLATAMLGLGSLLFSLSQGVVMGAFTRALVGVAAGVTLLPCMKLASNWFSPKYFGLASSAIIALSAAGNSMTGRPLAMAAESFGWRATFAGVGVIGLVWTILVFTIVRDRPKGPKCGQGEDEPLPPAPIPTPGFMLTAKTILKIPAFWLIGFLYVGTDMIYFSFNALWVGPYLMEVYGQPEIVVGNMISLAAISYFVGPPLLTLWGTFWSYSKVILMVTILNVGLAIFFVTSPEIPGVWVLYLLCFLSPVGAQLTAMILVLGRELVPEHIGGSAMGFLNLFPIIGGAVMQKLVGRLLTVAPDQGEVITNVRELYGYAFTPVLMYLIFVVFLAFWLVRYQSKSKNRLDSGS